MRRVLVGLSFEPRPNSRALDTDARTRKYGLTRKVVQPSSSTCA